MIPYTQPRGAVHDLTHLLNLSDERTNLLCVSDRTLYLLQNWAALDVDFSARYAVEFLERGYIPVGAEWPTQWALYREVANNLKLEITDMSCDVVAALGEIASAIAALSVQIQVNAGQCCSYTMEPGTYYDDPPGYGAPANKCDLSWSYAETWAAGAKEMYHQWSLGGFPSVGVLEAILDDLDLPGTVLLELVTFAASHTLPMLESAWAAIVDSLVEDVACAIYAAPGSQSAKSEVDAVIAAYPDLHPTALFLLQSAVSYSGLNKVFDGTFPVAYPGAYDCGDCDELPPYDECCQERDFNEESDPGPGYPLAGVLSWGASYGRSSTAGYRWLIENSGVIYDNSCAGTVLASGFAQNIWLYIASGELDASFNLRLVFTDDSYVDGTLHYKQTPPSWQNPGLGALEPHFGKSIHHLEFRFVEGASPSLSIIYLDDYVTVCP
jgi:hypothetical protein